MTDQLRQLQRLAPVLNSVFLAEQSKLAGINARIEGLKEQLRSLDRKHELQLHDPAIRAGADMRWRTWVQDRRTLINREILSLKRQRLDIKQRVAKALSRLEACKSLVEKTQAEADALRARRRVD